jgi:hypothetical protein
MTADLRDQRRLQSPSSQAGALTSYYYQIRRLFANRWTMTVHYAVPIHGSKQPYSQVDQRSPTMGSSTLSLRC